MTIQYKDFKIKHLSDDLPILKAEDNPIPDNAVGVRPQDRLPKDWKPPIYRERNAQWKFELDSGEGISAAAIPRVLAEIFSSQAKFLLQQCPKSHPNSNLPFVHRSLLHSHASMVTICWPLEEKTTPLLADEIMDQLRNDIWDHVYKAGPQTVAQLAEKLQTSADMINAVVDHAWFLREADTISIASS